MGHRLALIHADKNTEFIKYRQYEILSLCPSWGSIPGFIHLLYRTGQLKDGHVHGQHDKPDQQSHDNHEHRLDGR